MDEVRVLVVYDSVTGNVEKMSEEVAEGVRGRGGKVEVRRAEGSISTRYPCTTASRSAPPPNAEL